MVGTGFTTKSDSTINFCFVPVDTAQTDGGNIICFDNGKGRRRGRRSRTRTTLLSLSGTKIDGGGTIFVVVSTSTTVVFLFLFVLLVLDTVILVSILRVVWVQYVLMTRRRSLQEGSRSWVDPQFFGRPSIQP